MSKVFVGIRLEEETLKEFEQMAVNKRRKTSELMRLVLEDYVDTVNKF